MERRTQSLDRDAEPRVPGIVERVKVATRISAQLSAHCMDETDSVREAFSS